MTQMAMGHKQSPFVRGRSSWIKPVKSELPYLISLLRIPPTSKVVPGDSSLWVEDLSPWTVIHFSLAILLTRILLHSRNIGCSTSWKSEVRSMVEPQWRLSSWYNDGCFFFVAVQAWGVKALLCLLLKLWIPPWRSHSPFVITAEDRPSK